MIRKLSFVLLTIYALNLSAQTVSIKNDSDERVKIIIKGWNLEKEYTRENPQEKLGGARKKTLSIAPGREEEAFIDIVKEIEFPTLEDPYTGKKPYSQSIMYLRHTRAYTNAKKGTILLTITSKGRVVHRRATKKTKKEEDTESNTRQRETHDTERRTTKRGIRGLLQRY